MLNIWGQSEYYNAWRNTDVKDGGIGQVGYTLVANKWGQSPFLEIVDEVRMLHRVGPTTREC